MDKQIIVLTGGIASGKTFASDYLATLNAHVIDTDVIARQLLQEDGNQYSFLALNAVRDYFGQSIFMDDKIDRKKLRDIVFSDPDAKKVLEDILHPLILKEVHAQLQSEQGAYHLIAVPLLRQNSPYIALANQILVIEVAPEIQLERLKQRDHISESLALNIIHAQLSNQERRMLGNTIIVNTNEQYTQNVLKQLDKQYSLAAFKEGTVK